VDLLDPSGEPTESGWRDLINTDLQLALRVPAEWDVRVLDETRFGVFSDVADEEDYRANVTFLIGRPEQPGLHWFDEFCNQAPGQLAATLDGFELIGTDADLIDDARLFAVRYRQHAEPAAPTSHLQAYLWVDSWRMYLIDAATLRQHEERDLPVLSAITGTLRPLAPRVNEASAVRP
jgi:hypothetical protein